MVQTRRQKTPTKAKAAPAPAAAAVPTVAMKRIDKLDDLDQANNKLKTTYEENDRQRAIQDKKLDKKEKQLLGRLSKLEEEKSKNASANGNVDVSDDDVLEINAGGKVIAVKRATMTQVQGSRLEALFSGRWDKKLIRDSSGRLFLDVNSDCFQAIVDYVNELAISSEDEPPTPPTVENELRHILAHQMKLFGLSVDPQIDSNIITQRSDATSLCNWLEEVESGGELELLYRSSEDGLSGSAFHFNCDEQGATVVIIETTEGEVIGGYTNTSWFSSTGSWACADKAFIFALSGFGLSSPCKMNLMNASDKKAIYNYSSLGPAFGRCDLFVKGSTVTINIGQTYERGSSKQLTKHRSYYIKEMEVFKVTDNPISSQGCSCQHVLQEGQRCHQRQVDHASRARG